jgi:hypothetical protein
MPMKKALKTNGPATVMTAPAPNVLSKTCMLVSVKVSVWSARRQDKKMSEAAADSIGAQHDRARAIKYLIDPKALTAVTSAGATLRGTLYYFTMPWLDDGARVMKSAAYWEFRSTISPRIEEFNAEVEKLAKAYPALAAEGRAALGTGVGVDEYPRDIRDRFDAKVQFLPFPDAEDFRVDGLNGAAADIKKSIAQVANTITEQARVSIAERVKIVADRYVKRLASFQRKLDGSKAPGDRRNLDEDLIEGARELIGLLPMLNVADDPFVDDLVKRLDVLAATDVEALIESGAARERTAAQAQAIIDTMAEFV